MNGGGMLDLYQLRTFHALGSTGSFTRAAQRLNLTQSAVSHAIAKLEASAGVPLVDRKGRGAALTGEGRRLFRACEQVFATLDEAAEDLGLARATGPLRLGATVEFGSSILLKHIRPLLEQHPELEVDFTLAHDPITPLLRDELDLVVDCRDCLEPDLLEVPLFRETYVVAASPAFLDAHPVNVPADLEDLRVLSLDKAGAWWHRFQAALPEASRPELRRVVEINHIRAMINAAVEGLGVLLAPTYSVLGELERGALWAVLPAVRPREDRFRIYQRKTRAGLSRHRLVTEYLRTLNPPEF